MTTVNNNLTVKHFKELLINHYRFNVLYVIELINKFESKLNT